MAGEERHHPPPRPILRKLDAIECRDALLTAVGEGRLAVANSTRSVMHGLDPRLSGSCISPVEGELG